MSPCLIMRILAVDTSAAVMSAAIVDENSVLAEYSINNKKMHSQNLMPAIEGMLESCGTDINSIDCFAAAVGPGSFTGLRIGVCTIKGFAYAMDKPVVGIPTLDGLAYNAFVMDMVVCPVMDARNEQVYTAAYKHVTTGGIPRRITDYMAVHVDELMEKLSEMKEHVFLLGDGVLAYGDRFLKGLKDRCHFAPAHINIHRASSIGHLALIKAKAGEVQQNTDLLPFYLRQSQAERKFGSE